MFSKITGNVVERQGDRVILETGGLGYEILLPPCLADKVPSSNGAPVSLEIYSHLQMDGNAGRFMYFGFTNAIEREFFEALLSVASIGPKSAARAFALPMARIARAIDEGDHALLRTLPGIGQQKARDIVAKLQGKVARFLLIRPADDAAPHVATPAMPDFAEEALAVLLQLEYKRNEAEALIRESMLRQPQIADAESLLGEIYRTRANHEKR
ncbi:MAG TPA: Holliday junction branch migration protein RuvA [Candidatus Acidoferrales bacterium]|nr:Holliday junction branch migration protein RuvA [Candidatus Acidoferrales bacterium]